jgi:hypothetical protein
MAKGLLIAQTSYNGATLNSTSVVLNTTKINGIAAEGTGSTIYYKNLDGSMVNIVGASDDFALLLEQMNEANATDVVMLTLPDAVTGIDFYVPTASIYMASELPSGNCMVVYATSANDSLIQVEVTLTASDFADAMNA